MNEKEAESLLPIREEKDEILAIACYDALIEAMYNPENNLMLSTEKWLFHTLDNFYVNRYHEFRIVSYDSTVKRTIANHDLDWYNTICLPWHDIQINIMNDCQSQKVDIYFALVQRNPGEPIKDGEDEVVIKVDSFYYYTASPLIRVTKELQELKESENEIGYVEYREKEMAMAYKQLDEQPWNRKGGKN